MNELSQHPADRNPWTNHTCHLAPKKEPNLSGNLAYAVGAMPVKFSLCALGPDLR